MTGVEKNAKEWLIQKGHAESEILRRYGRNPSFYLVKGGKIVKALEPKACFSTNSVFLTQNELSELRACEYPVEIVVFRKNSPAKPIISISINDLNGLGGDNASVTVGDFEVTVLPEQMIVKDRKTIKALSVVPRSIINNLRLIYELGDPRIQTRFLRLLQGALKDISLETLTDESFREEVEHIRKENEEVIARRTKKEEEGQNKEAGN